MGYDPDLVSTTEEALAKYSRLVNSNSRKSLKSVMLLENTRKKTAIKIKPLRKSVIDNLRQITAQLH